MRSPPRRTRPVDRLVAVLITKIGLVSSFFSSLLVDDEAVVIGVELDCTSAPDVVAVWTSGTLGSMITVRVDVEVIPFWSVTA